MIILYYIIIIKLYYVPIIIAKKKKKVKKTELILTLAPDSPDIPTLEQKAAASKKYDNMKVRRSQQINKSINHSNVSKAYDRDNADHRHI